MQQLWKPRSELGYRHRRLPSQGCEESPQISPHTRRQQRLIAEKLRLVGLVQLREGLALIQKKNQRRAAVGQRRVEAVTDKLVILDQPVIRVLWKRQWRQTQGVDDRQSMQSHAGKMFAQDRQIVVDDIVAEHETRPVGQCIQLLQSWGRVSRDLQLQLCP